ncbi:hypothetical protein NHX12_012821, partial [Muraenolepis orangiensis]
TEDPSLLLLLTHRQRIPPRWSSSSQTEDPSSLVLLLTDRGSLLAAKSWLSWLFRCVRWLGCPGRTSEEGSSVCEEEDQRGGILCLCVRRSSKEGSSVCEEEQRGRILALSPRPL